MYPHDLRQKSFFDDSPERFGTIPLNPDNRWVKLAKLIPWDLVEEEYQKNFTTNRGGKAYSARFALGTLLVKETLDLSDRATVEMIREHPYIQYFLGMTEYNYDISLDASLLTHFRKRFPADVIQKVNAFIVDHQLESKNEDSDDDDDSIDGGDEADESEIATVAESNKGTLILDATCVPADIQYPTDVRLLHESRLLLEGMMDKLQPGRDKPKPRNYREKANIHYKRFCRNRRPSRKKVRKALRKQLGYVRRDLKIVAEMIEDSKIQLNDKDLQHLETIRKLYEQQQEMYDSKSRRCADRIVSLHQPHVRPIVRGKVSAPTEFGSKVGLSMVDGYAEITRISWGAYNESTELQDEAERYKERFGCYPKRILGDKIYRTRANLRFCKEHGIHLNGRPLGRPSSDPTLLAKQKSQEREEASERNAIEGKFGEAKRRYGLDRIYTRLQETSETQIHLVVLVMNLQKILRDLFVSIFHHLFFVIIDKKNALSST